MVEIIVFIFLISTIYILLHYLRTAHIFRSHFQKNTQFENHSIPVSVVICARNEASTLFKNLEFILNQNYPKFEVVVVDDCSDDSTINTIQLFQKEYSNLKLVSIRTKTSKSKRDALKKGILASKYDTILLTDADCKPSSSEWIKSMSGRLSSNTSCVLGYSPYFKSSGFLNDIIQFETFQTASLYMSRAIIQKAYMSVGRNVMYSKSLFLEYENFDNEKHLTSGDDDLLIQNIKDKNQIDVNLDPRSFVFSQPKTDFKSWWNQKLRHYSASTHYKTSSQLFLGMFHLFHGLFWLSFIYLLFSQFITFALLIVGITFLIKSILMLCNARIFKISRSIIWLWPILEVSLIFLQYGLGLHGTFKKQNSWQ